MNVLVLLIFASLAIATAFLAGFIWAVRSGQYEDTCTPSMRLLTDDMGRSDEVSTGRREHHRAPVPAVPIVSEPSSNKKIPVHGNGRVVAKPGKDLDSPA